MTNLTANAFNDWYKELDSGGYGHGPESKFSELEWDSNTREYETPFGKMALEDEYREDSSYYFVYKVADRFFIISGSYSSWEGVDFYGYESWSEVTKKTKTVEYWG